MSTCKYDKPSEREMRERLSDVQFDVTQRGGTERPFQNEYWDNHEPGIYVDVVTGEPLFTSKDKFDSGTGWPSFTQPIEPNRVNTRADTAHGMRRTEVRSRGGDSHLGHVFRDGPAPSGLRYCINSAALRFVPLDQLEQQGYGEYRALFAPEGTGEGSAERGAASECRDRDPAHCEVAVLAGGCFWGMEDILRSIDGVLDTEVGYTGGSSPNPTYEDVKKGSTGHAEAVRVVFDPAKLSYRDLLEKWFFRMHDPTTLNRQGNDVGTQYRSAIFVASPEQRRVAEEVKASVGKSGKWPRPVVTEIVSAGSFTPAETYHQDYLSKHPNGYTCHYLRD